MIIKNIATVLSMLFLIGCRMGKDYTPPPVELPSTFENVAYADTNSIADINWHQFFTDTSLNNLITKGLLFNHDLLIASKRLDIAERELRQSKQLQLPEVNLQLGASYNRPSDNSLNGLSAQGFLGKSHIENYQAIVGVSWEADIWGKISRQKEIARASYLQRAESVKAVQTRLVADIAAAYFNLLMLDEQLIITKKNLQLNESFLSATRLLKDAGNVTQLAVEQAEAQKLSTALLIPQLQAAMAIQENALQVLTGQLPGMVSRTAVLSDYQLPLELPAGLPVAMLRRRPDVKESELQLVAANAQVGVSKASMYPALNLTVGAGLETFTASNWYNIPGSLFGLAAGTIAQPLFNRGKLKTNFEVAKLDREKSVIVFRQSVLKATEEVMNALKRAEKLKEEESIALNQTATLKKAIGNAELLFKSDLANYLEVLTAQGNALQSELNLAQIQRSRLTAMVELYRSLGGGWN